MNANNESEREALIEHALNIATKGIQINDGHRYMVPAHDLVEYAETIKALIELLRRTEVPEPSAKRAEREHEAARHISSLIERSSLGTPEAQALRATVSDEKAQALVSEAQRRSEPQGEPSAAQVEAALIAHLGYDPAPAGYPFKDGEKEQMRAALRAAQEVR